MFKLRREAALAAAQCRDADTVGAALDSRFPSVRTWALLNFETRGQSQSQWLELLPKLIRLLHDPDSGFRQMAVEKLFFYPEGRRAIAEQEPHELDPNVLLSMARSGSSPAFYGSLIRLLSSADAAVRESALSFIDGNLSNSATAPMWRLGFDPEVRRQRSQTYRVTTTRGKGERHESPATNGRGDYSPPDSLGRQRKSK